MYDINLQTFLISVFIELHVYMVNLWYEHEKLILRKDKESALI
jgi:hypothetical protein